MLPFPTHTVYIEIIDEGTITLDVSPIDTLQDFKSNIQSVTDIPPTQQQLIYNSILLIDETKTIQDYNINNDAQMILVKKQTSGKIKIPIANANVQNNLNNDNPIEVKFKLFIAIDFGTDGLGLAYAYNGQVHPHSKWHSKRHGTKIKPKTMVLIKKNGQNGIAEAVSFGVDARYSYMDIGKKDKNYLFFERFKMSLYEHKIATTIDSDSDDDDDIDEKKDINDIKDDNQLQSNNQANKPVLVSNSISKDKNAFNFAEYFSALTGRIKKKKAKNVDKNVDKYIQKQTNKQNVIHEGWLKMKSRHLKKWKERYICIGNNYLYSFKDPNHSLDQCTEKIDLSGSLVLYSSDKPYHFELHLYTMIPKRSSVSIQQEIFSFQSVNNDANEIKEWVKQINYILLDTIDNNDNDNDTDDDDTDNDDVKEAIYKINIEDKLKAADGQECDSEFVFVTTFKYVKDLAHKYISDKKRNWKVDASEIQWIITVPAIWNDSAKNRMKQWAIKAGVINKNIKNQCKIVYEPDCAALAIQHQIFKQKLKRQQKVDSDWIQNNIVMDDVNINDDIDINNDDDKILNSNIKFEKGEKYVLVDSGGGTSDVACHEILDAFGVKEILPPSGGKWGSCYIDDEYIKILKQIFSDDVIKSLKNDSPTEYTELMLHFQNAKCTFYNDTNANIHSCILPNEVVRYFDQHIDSEQLINTATINGQKHMVQFRQENKLNQQNNAAKYSSMTPLEIMKEWKLEQYATILIEDEGYDEIEDWPSLTFDELIEMGFKKGKAKQFMRKANTLKNNTQNNNHLQGGGDIQQDDTYYLDINVSIWKFMFNQVIHPTIEHVKKLLNKKKLANCKYLCLVGGLSCSNYFQSLMKKEFGGKSKYKLELIIPEPSPILTVVTGAAYFGITKDYICARVLRRSYGVEVKWRKDTCKRFGISNKYIQKNQQFDEFRKNYYVRGCFRVLAKKNDEILTNKIIQYKVARSNIHQMIVNVPILCSFKKQPKIFSDGIVLGQINVEFNNRNPNDMTVIIEFHFYDTLIKVFAYREIEPSAIDEIELQYFSYN